jgi:hypothetical protein
MNYNVRYKSSFCDDIFISGEWIPNYLINSESVMQAFVIERNGNQLPNENRKFQKIIFRSYPVIIPKKNKKTNFKSSDPLYKFYQVTKTFFSPQVFNVCIYDNNNI